MNLNPIKANMTELQLNDWFVLFSYKTPVAAIDRSTGKAFKTAKHWSRTTSKHINQYFLDVLHAPNGATIEEKPQEWFDSITVGVK